MQFLSPTPRQRAEVPSSVPSKARQKLAAWAREAIVFYIIIWFFMILITKDERSTIVLAPTSQMNRLSWFT